MALVLNCTIEIGTQVHRVKVITEFIARKKISLPTPTREIGTVYAHKHTWEVEVGG